MSLVEAVRHPVSTIIVAGAPLAVVLLFSVVISPQRVAQWMLQTEPEISLICVIGRLAIWNLADLIMTVGIAHLWWFHHGSFYQKRGEHETTS